MSQTFAAECFLGPELRCCLQDCGGGFLLPILPQVLGIAGAPLPGTVAADVALFGIGSKFTTVIIGAATALTVGFASQRIVESGASAVSGLVEPGWS
jgi:hypothetical protein